MPINVGFFSFAKMLIKSYNITIVNRKGVNQKNGDKRCYQTNQSNF